MIENVLDYVCSNNVKMNSTLFILELLILFEVEALPKFSFDPQRHSAEQDLPRKIKDIFLYAGETHQRRKIFKVGLLFPRKKRNENRREKRKKKKRKEKKLKKTDIRAPYRYSQFFLS